MKEERLENKLGNIKIFQLKPKHIREIGYCEEPKIAYCSNYGKDGCMGNCGYVVFRHNLIGDTINHQRYLEYKKEKK